MYTRCPTCQTLFRIRAQQLKAARGQVRCGECQTTFDALEFLVNQDELSERELAASTTVSDREVRQWHLPFDNEPALPLFMPPPSEELAAESGHEPLSAAQIEMLLTPESAAGTTTRRDDAVAEGAAQLPEIVAQAVQSSGSTAPLTIPQHTDDAPALPASAEPDVRRLEAVTLASPVPTDMELGESAARPRYSLPEEELPPPSSFWRQLGWSIASLLLIALLVGQLTFINRNDLAKDPAWRPWLEQGCALLDCTLPTQRDLSAIEMVERTVLSHPDYQKALLITATLVNKASFAQPYPEVELTMTDLEQKPVAQRRFLPREYLSDANPAGLFPAGGSVRLRLEIADPGDDAVGFEFDFH